MKTITDTFKQQEKNGKGEWVLRVGYVLTCDQCGKETYHLGKSKTAKNQSRRCRCEQGKPSHPLYGTWNMMRQRCNNRNAPNYHHYGGRGIKVCDSWNHDFTAFINDVGERPEGCTLDRIDNDGNYEPGNCRWATASEQQLNKRNNKTND